MAMDVGGAKGGVKSDINVTPLVDVMLVLLIIMMLIAPLLQQGVQLTLPKAVNTRRSSVATSASTHRRSSCCAGAGRRITCVLPSTTTETFS